MNNRFFSLACNPKDATGLGEDFIIIETVDVAAIKGIVIKSTCNIILNCLEGEMRLKADLVETTIHKGEFLYIMSGQFIEITDAADSCQVSALLLSDLFLQWLDLKHYMSFRDNSGHAISSSAQGSFEKFIGICKEIIILDPNPEKKDVIQLMTRAYFLGISHFGVFTDQKTSNNNASERITKQFLDLLYSEKEFHRAPEYYADKVNVTSKHLSFSTRLCTGFSALHWINQVSILTAKEMLSDSNCQISEIADRLGFSNQSVFGRFFKKHTGLSPIEYRKEHHLM